MSSQAVNSSGNYKPEDNLFYFEEQLLISESVFTEAFLQWVHDNNKTFGANVKDVYAQFAKTDAYRAAQQRYQDDHNGSDEFDISNMTLTEVKVTEFTPRSQR